LKIINGDMITVFKVIVELIYLDTSLIFESLLIVVYDVQFVFIVLEQHSAVINQISHVTLQVQHNTPYFLNNLVDRQHLMAHFLKLGSAFTTDTNFSSFVKVCNLIHVVIRARICDACSTCYTSAHCTSRHKSTCVLRNLLLNRSVKV